MSDIGGGRLMVLGLGCAALGGVAGWLASGLDADRRFHDYLVTHPEVLPEAMEALRRREDAGTLAKVGGEVANAFPGAVLGNPAGRHVLVEFTDFACGFCRRSAGDVQQLIARDPELKVVVRQLPIIAPESVAAARMGLAAARQGRYPAYHAALFAIGRPDAAGVAQAAGQAGVDMAAAKVALADPALDAEISRNLEFARKLGISGTPAWIAGGRLLTGAVGEEALAQALAEKAG